MIADLDNLIGEGRGVELGVFTGDLSFNILNLWKGGTMFLIDIWRI